MKMSYAIIQPPFTLDFPKMSKPELRAYFDWFLAQIPGRIRELERAVRSSRRFSNWRANSSRRSLDPLGEWFIGQAKYRRLTAEEKAEDRARHFPFDSSGEDLTNRTFSLAMDIGMYLSEVMRKQHPQIQWFQILTPKKDADYGQPVLIDFGSSPFNPVDIVITVAYSAARKECAGTRLRKAYEIWSEMVVGGR